jgi:DNA/RNA-binding domain of Phe-tRNA-synthetase-like protein
VSDEEAAPGWVVPEVAGEFPELRLWWLEVPDVGPPRGHPALRERLRHLSDRYRGPQAATLRSQPIPHAYRVFFRQIGLDPDVDRVPVEALVVERLTAGGFRSGRVLDDAVTVAVMETSVPVWALDADTVQPPLGIRTAGRREALGRRADAWVPEGRLVVADSAGAVATVFGDVAPEHRVGPRTRSGVLFSLQVAGVPAIHVSEALWTVSDILEDAG